MLGEEMRLIFAPALSVRVCPRLRVPLARLFLCFYAARGSLALR
jgi:hypothetical protein